MRRELDWIEIPGEHEARERAWRVVSAAFATREPVTRTRSWRPLVLVAAGLTVVAAAFSPPGRAVLDEVRDAVLPAGVQRTEAALFSLPAPGRLLVVSAEQGGVWVVRRDGSRRRLGDYEDARWSPFGRFIVATRRNGLYALTPEGKERWSLARREVQSPTWGGTRFDTRIAYVARSGLRVVEGDGDGDRLLARGDIGPFAWQPGSRRQLLHLTTDGLSLLDVDTGRILWRRPFPFHQSLGVSWSADGRRALAVSRFEVRVFDARGRRLRRIVFPRSEIVAASFAPSGHTIGILRREPGTVTDQTRTSVSVLDVDRSGSAKRIFTGRGDFGELAWSPNGRFILVAWRSADRWLFINRSTRYAIAIDRIESQFPRPDGRPPLLLVSDRWSAGG